MLQLHSTARTVLLALALAISAGLAGAALVLWSALYDLAGTQAQAQRLQRLLDTATGQPAPRRATTGTATAGAAAPVPPAALCCRDPCPDCPRAPPPQTLAAHMDGGH